MRIKEEIEGRNISLRELPVGLLPSWFAEFDYILEAILPFAVYECPVVARTDRVPGVGLVIVGIAVGVVAIPRRVDRSRQRVVGLVGAFRQSNSAESVDCAAGVARLARVTRERYTQWLDQR